LSRTLTERELNRALLERQLLLGRKRATLPKALERIGGVQAQYAPSMYIGLWSRVDGFERDGLTRALERRTAVQATLLRSTIHLVSARDYWPFAVAVRDARRQWYLRVHRARNESELVDAAEEVRRRLADGPLRRAELVEPLGTELWNGVGLWLSLVRVPPSGTWEQRRADLFATAEDWLGPPQVSREESLERLVRSYLGGFGPAAATDVASWAGIAVGEITPVLERLKLRRFRDERGDELVDLPRAPLPDGDTPAPVRFLPTWDATLLVHARRTGILPEPYRPLVFNTRRPHSVGTFLVDGAVAGAWRYEKGRVLVEPFERLTSTDRKEVEEEADRLATFHG
jgi:hypothetical protein